MSKPERGSLGDWRWDVERQTLAQSRRPIIVVRIGAETIFVSTADRQHLRDFARALDRAADALEAADLKARR